MKAKIFTLLLMIVSLGIVQAQRLFEENFDYPAERPLILNAAANTGNYDELTGWTTQSNSKAGENMFNITSAPLTYEGYSEGIGNALKYIGFDGQSVFKGFEKTVRGDSTIYISFLINFNGNEYSDGGDFLFGIKMDRSATQSNWRGRIHAKVDNETKKVVVGIGKATATGVSWLAEGKELDADKTYLFVFKYYIGPLNGTNATEEAGKYDDKMWLYINPPVDGTEPATADLFYENANESDIYRYTSTGSIFGGAASFYLRSTPDWKSATYTIDHLRAGLKWEDLFDEEDTTSVVEVPTDEPRYYLSEKRIHLLTQVPVSTPYRVISITGQTIMSGRVTDNSPIDVSHLKNGLYILTLDGLNKALKVLVH
jgi:hypothetical protein